MQFLVTDPAAMIFHNEAIMRDGRIVGTVTSGAYGHTLGGTLGLGYVPCIGQDPEDLLDSDYEIEIAGTRYPAKVRLQPPVLPMLVGPSVKPNSSTYQATRH